MKKLKLLNLTIEQGWKRPEHTPTLEEQVARAREVKAQAKLALLGPPRPDPKPEGRDGYFQERYTGLTWRGHKIEIKKNRWGW